MRRALLVAILVAYSCKTADPETGSQVRELNGVLAPPPFVEATPVHSEAFSKYCKNAATLEKAARRMLMDTLMWVYEGIGAQSALATKSCDQIWGQILTFNRPIGLMGIEDVAATEMFKDHPALDLSFSLIKYPKHTEVLKTLNFTGIGFNKAEPGFTQPSDTELDNLLKVVVGLPGLKRILLDELGLKSLQILAPLKNVELLSAGQNQIASLEFAKDWEHLRTLELWRNQIEDLSPINNLLELESLTVSENRIKNLDPLMTVANLSTLQLSGNKEIQTLTAVGLLPNLKRLHLRSTNLKNIDSLKDLQLTILDLTDNPLTTLEPLRGNAFLSQLYVSATKVTDIDAIKDMPNLSKLQLGNTAVKKFPELAADTKMIIVDVSGTQISNPCAVIKLPKLLSYRAPGGGIYQGTKLADLKATCH